MTKTLTASYETGEAARNAYNDLIGKGYPREKVFLSSSKHQLKMIIPVVAEPQAREILNRHQPNKIAEKQI